MSSKPLLQAAILATLTATTALAQTPSTQPTSAPTTQNSEPRTQNSELNSWSLDPIIVNAEKQFQKLQDVPESITVVGPETMKDADIKDIREASRYVPDLNLSAFQNRRLSFPYFRGIGSGQNAPAVTTNIDGVPQLSFKTSNQEFLDIHDIEFIRGPQGTLYGRNSMGGVLNINSNPPSNKLSIESTSNFGNFNFYDERTTVNLPLIKDHLIIRASGGISARNGYTKNDFTGNDVDRKEAEFGKLSIWFAPNDNFDMTLRINAERDRDGDYPLGDLQQIRNRPWHVNHAFEGNSLRDIAATSLTMNYYTEYVTFTSITGFTDWRSQDVSGIDYTTFDLIHRQNREHENDISQELRASSPKDHPLQLTPDLKLSWLAGVFFFGSDYSQTATNSFSPALVFQEQLPFNSSSNLSGINQKGLGVFGQATLTVFEKLDLTAGIRFDAERDHANLTSSTDTGIPPASNANPGASFDNVSTRWGIGYHWTPDFLTYASAAQGYKAGGFNASAPSAANTSFTPDQNWTYEVGAKTSWFKNKLTLNVDYFYVDWRNMQLDVPFAPGASYIGNVGKAHSQGLEFEATAKPTENWLFFAGMAYMQSQFDSSLPANPGLAFGGIRHGNDLPFAPEITFNVGAEYSVKLCSQIHAFARAEEVGSGRYFYDASNGASQGAYAMTNFRLGLRGNHWALEGWVENAFEAKTVPMAFPYDKGFAPSGYIGENGIPRLYGITLKLDF